MTVRRGVLVGVAAYLLFLVATAPAAWAVRLLESRLPGLQASGVSGSLWSGRAQRLSIDNITVTDLDWSWRPLAVLLGRAEYRLRGQWLASPVSLRAGVGVTGSAYLADVSAKVVAQALLEQLYPQAASLNGQLTMELDTVDFSTQGQLPLISGDIHWQQAGLDTPVNLRLGEVALLLTPADDKTTGTLNAKGGQLLVDGELSLAPAGGYTLDAKIRANGQLPSAVENGLRTFADYKNGEYQLKLNGNLFSLL